ncbi:MAG: ThiF family adenylyltransferase [Candidatus Dormibacteraeota bacterium]|nr:ThiF family adenylyltransferase [Candidatus Dormibacteraeota bacterium]
MIPIEHEAYYTELTLRNRGLISEAEQTVLRRTRFVIAGCGSTGGACIMPLARTGAERFLLLDPGQYDLNNLNRQEAALSDVGRNKGEAARARIVAVNPFAAVEVDEHGVEPLTIAASLKAGDVVIDAVDVTTQPGVDAKLALHRACCEKQLLTLTAYDIAATQYLELFDYRTERRPLGGRITGSEPPDRLLRALIPPLAVPREIFAELLARRSDPARAFPQLAMTSTLLGALIVPYILRLLTGQPVRRRMRVDLYDLIRPMPQRAGERARRVAGLASLWWRLRG